MAEIEVDEVLGLWTMSLVRTHLFRLPAEAFLETYRASQSCQSCVPRCSARWDLFSHRTVRQTRYQRGTEISPGARPGWIVCTVLLMCCAISYHKIRSACAFQEHAWLAFQAGNARVRRLRTFSIVNLAMASCAVQGGNCISKLSLDSIWKLISLPHTNFNSLLLHIFGLSGGKKKGPWLASRN